MCSMKNKILLHTEISTDDLIEDLIILDNETLVEIIKSIDRQCACYDFTKELRDYFVKEMEETYPDLKVRWRAKKLLQKANPKLP